ncbi:MAG: DUF6352 family protein [Rhodospirillales bacterium]
MKEFWVSSGHHMTSRRDDGGLAVTDELLLAYLARPELKPPPEACAAERALHEGLLADPRRAVPPAAIAAIADADARENWQFMLAFRDRLVGAASVEAAYLDLARKGTAGVPPLFMNQLVHLILRNALDGCDDPYTLRAGELFFRAQRASVHEGALLLADAERVDEAEADRHAAPLAAMFAGPAIEQLDIMTDETAWTYWSRSDAFTMALNLGGNPRSREGLARAIEAWIRHMLGTTVLVTPERGLVDEDWRWFVGLDAEATRIGNALWQGRKLDPGAEQRLLAVFKMSFVDESAVLSAVKGHPVWLLLAETPDRVLRMKPQNLLVGLPLVGGAARPS